MRKLAIILAFLCAALTARAQQSDLHIGPASLTAACTNANTTCDSQNTPNFGSNGSVLGPATLEFNTTGYGLAVVTMNGQLSNPTGATLFFEFSDDGGTSWFQNVCTRTDTNLQESSEAIPSATYRAWDCAVGAATRGRVRQSAIGSGTTVLSVTLTSGLVEPAPTIQIATAGPNGANHCQNSNANLQSVAFTTAGTTAVQEIALSGTTKVYICSMSVVGQSGTTPTFSLVFGTGSNCGTGQGTLIPAFATPANTMLQFANPVTVTTTGQAVCYLQTGTTPVTVAALTYVQQ